MVEMQHAASLPVKKSPAEAGLFHFGRGLLVYWNLDDVLLVGVGHELGLVVNVELAHEVELVGFDGLYTQSEDDCDFLYVIALRQQCEDVALSRSLGSDWMWH